MLKQPIEFHKSYKFDHIDYFTLFIELSIVTIYFYFAHLKMPILGETSFFL